MEFNFRGIDVEEKEVIPILQGIYPFGYILPAWAYSKEEIKKLLDQYIADQKLFVLHT